MKEIRKWLESGQDYAQGVALYETHGKSRVVLTALQFGATEFTRQRLVKELRKLLEEKTAQPPAPAPAIAAKRVATSPPAPPPRERGEGAGKREASRRPVEPTPEVAAQRRAWFAERNHLHPQLELVATDAERLTMSLRILELADLISQSYEAAPVAVHLATPSLAAIVDQGEIRRLLANLKPQRSKLKHRPDRAADLAQVELDIQLLEGRLKRDGGEPKL